VLYLGQFIFFVRHLIAFFVSELRLNYSYAFFQRVVVIEDILHLKSSLEAHKNDTSEDKLLEILEKLKLMNPSTKVLKDTRIGRSVNKLRNSEYQSVKELSRLIVKKWKKLVVEENTQKESIDVQCDAKTELSRCKARKLICDSLNINVSWPFLLQQFKFHFDLSFLSDCKDLIKNYSTSYPGSLSSLPAHQDPGYEVENYYSP
jgi:hypothetical protein